MHSSKLVADILYVFISLIYCGCAFGGNKMHLVTEQILLPIGESLSRTCYNGQSWCYSLTEGGSCTSLLFSGRKNGIDIEGGRGSEGWTFTIDKAVQDEHTGYYMCGSLTILVYVVELITLIQGESFSRTCHSEHLWCHTEPDADSCNTVAFPTEDLKVYENNSMWTLNILNAQSTHCGRYRCGDQDLLVKVLIHDPKLQNTSEERIATTQDSRTKPKPMKSKGSLCRQTIYGVPFLLVYLASLLALI